MGSLVLEAEKFAKYAHANQMRKYTGEPYWYHCASVATLVECVEHDDVMLAAAWLHDVVEDTEYTHADIDMRFGAEVSRLVQWLTIPTTMKDGNRETRKRLDREYIEKAPDRAKTIKLADLIDNTPSIVDHDPDFAAIYLKEKALLLSCLLGGSPNLMFMAQSHLRVALRKLSYINR